MAEMKSGSKGGGKKLTIKGADASLHEHMGSKKKGGKKSKGMKLPGKK